MPGVAILPDFFVKNLKNILKEKKIVYIIRYMAKYRTKYIKDVTNILKALGSVSRIRIVMSLFGRELCVCQIIELLGLAPSTVSKHLYILKRANLIEWNKKGRWVYYRLAEEGENKAARRTLYWLQESLVKDARIREDKKLLEEILKEDPEQLCLKIKKR